MAGARAGTILKLMATGKIDHQKHLSITNEMK